MNIIQMSAPPSPGWSNRRPPQPERCEILLDGLKSGKGSPLCEHCKGCGAAADHTRTPGSENSIRCLLSGMRFELVVSRERKALMKQFDGPIVHRREPAVQL